MPILNWLTREEDVQATKKVPYRLLEEVADLSYGDKDSGNMLIQGDNLEALKALLPFYAGQVKCIYIDPPYNTKSAFEHYDDNLEHSKWLAMMWPRMEVLRELLSENGSIWVSIDDNEAHYLKVIMDEAFGRRNFIVNVVWQKRTSPDARIHLGDAQDHVLVYGKNLAITRNSFNELSLNEEQRKAYKNPDKDPRGRLGFLLTLLRKGIDQTKCMKSRHRPGQFIRHQKDVVGATLKPCSKGLFQKTEFGLEKMVVQDHAKKITYQRHLVLNLGHGGATKMSGIIRKQKKKSIRCLVLAMPSTPQNLSD